MSTPLTRQATRRLIEMLTGDPSPQRLNAALRHLAKWRAQVLENTLVNRSGDTVLSGPFRGMKYAVRSSEGSRNARIIGCYEASLAPVIEGAIARAYPLVIDIGSAEGYYAVGLAMRMPNARVLARDVNPKAQVLCREMAVANGVAGRVEIGGEFTHADFDICTRQRTLVFCDIEGAEGALLDPALAPGLTRADLLVEVHEGMQAGLIDTLTTRFAATHDITRIGRKLDDSHLPDWAEDLSDLDRLILMWEWRSSPTPWLWLQSKDPVQ